jgi:stage II sporulation protein D
MRNVGIRIRSWGRLALATFLVFAIATPATAADFSFSGSGWGHGVGLSQYGAKAMAVDGATYEQIVSRYFTGGTPTSYISLHQETFIVTDPTPLWVGLRQQSANVGFAVENGTADLCFDATNLCVATARPGEVWQFSQDVAGNCIFFRRLSNGSVQLERPSAACEASVRPGSADTTLVIPVKARSYRNGILRFRPAPTTGMLQTVLEIGIKDYMRGLSEVPESWPTAAIEAQVVVSRSQAIWRVLDHGPADQFDQQRKDDCFCNLLDGSTDQVFRGHTGAATHPRWTAAVESTWSQVVGVLGGTALGLYSSSSGGGTESYLDVFGTENHPYLASVDDKAAFSDSAANPHAAWAAGYNQASLAAAFGFSWLVDAEVIERNVSGSARTVRLVGIIDGKPTETTVTGVEVRDALSLRSTTFDIVATPRFDDVLPTHQFAGEILGLHELGITTGCTATTFCPNRAVTRAEMAAFLTRALNLAPDGTADPFTDDDRSIFENEIETLHQHGITTGCTATTFCPNRAVTRAEMAAFLTRALA